MTGGAFAAIGLIASGPVLHWLPHLAVSLEGRAELWAMSSLVVFAWLAYAIARLAVYRFRNPADSDPHKTEPSPKAAMLERVLQNTLEQVVLAAGAYAIWAVIVPPMWGHAPIVAALLFSIGRLLFFWGYSRGAAARAIGFALTFYPTLALLFGSFIAVLRSI